MLTDRLRPLVALLYPEQQEQVTAALVALADAYAVRLGDRRPAEPLTERTAVLITYGGSVRRPGEAPLRTLAGLLRDRVGPVTTDLHLLPIYPWTSDDGFAVVDHRTVDPALGTWDDVADLARDHAVWLDFVANHTSSANPWFRGWLAGDEAYAGFYLEREAGFDTARVVRPRTSPLFTPFARADGSEVEVWTTFGADQVDVDVSTPAALLELTDVLLGYLVRGAGAVRLDAIGFLWKESGTACLHLPQTHAVIRLWRVLLDAVAPGTRLLTETNVPHAENVAYFGDGTDEAHLVYQFALPPLVLHAFVTGSTDTLRRWAAGIGPVGPSATWFNFLASHDGIGLRPTEGLLSDAERDALVQRALAHGGGVGRATRPDGTSIVYELNVPYLDALCTPDEAADPAVLAAKAVAAHSILLAVVGVPAIYLHSLLGSRPDLAEAERSGVARRINRPILDADTLLAELDTDPRRHAVSTGLLHLLEVRRTQPAFSPFAPQQVLDVDDRAFAVLRGSGPDALVCVANVTAASLTLPTLRGVDVLTGAGLDPVVLGPYGVAWLRSR